MSVVVKNLGKVTAYAYAVSKGYSGTEEQFSQELASIGNYTSLISLVYSTNTSYEVGDYCLYNGALYRCIIPIPSSESWSQSYWTEVNIGEELKRISDSIQETVTETDELKENIYNLYPIDTASGTLVHFTDGANSLPFKSISIPLSPVQSGTGDPSPSNVRPITGHDSVTITRTGRNFISTPTSSLTQNGITYTPMEDGSVHVEGTSTGTSYFNFSTWGAKLAPIMGKAGVELIMSGGTSDVLFYTQYRRTGSTSNVTLGLDNGSSASFTVPDDLDNYAIYLRVNSGKTIDTTVYPMLRLASDTDATFEPYTGTTYPVSFGSAGTVYGGTVDVVSGVLTVDRANVDLGTLSWDTTTVSEVQVFRSSGINSTVANPSEALFDCYKSETTLSSLTQNNGSAIARSTYWSSTNTRMVIHDERYTTAADLKTALSGHFVCYKLATPQTYQLTPAQVTTLLGTNNVWNDVGTMSVEYPADIKLYIDSRLQS